MKKIEKLIVFVFFMMVTPLWASCSSSSSPFDEEEDNEPEVEIVESDAPITKDVFWERYAVNCATGQSSACFGDYIFVPSVYLNTMTMYNMKTCQQVYTLETKNLVEEVEGGITVYHCNQSCFGPDRYDPQDVFPLLYISQRNNFTNRCFIQVLRIKVPEKTDGEYASFSVEQVQTIYLPSMTKSNALGNANMVIDNENRCMYTYSRNNNKEDYNYLQCMISKFNFPSVDKKKVYFEKKDILDSYYLGVTALNMQGGMIKNGKLYIGQGYKSSGSIFLRIVDLASRKLEKSVDLLNAGFVAEPEGLFIYDNRMMMTTNGPSIYEINKIDGENVW